MHDCCYCCCYYWCYIDVATTTKVHPQRVGLLANYDKQKIFAIKSLFTLLALLCVSRLLHFSRSILTSMLLPLPLTVLPSSNCVQFFFLSSTIFNWAFFPSFRTWQFQHVPFSSENSFCLHFEIITQNSRKIWFMYTFHHFKIQFHFQLQSIEWAQCYVNIAYSKMYIYDTLCCVSICRCTMKMCT